MRDRFPRGGPGGRWHLVILLAAVFVTTAWFFASGINNSIFRDWPDDALFYNLVAHNIASGLGSTSDGIALTNGYHPLWMMIHVLLSLCFHDSLLPEVVLQFLLTALALALLYQFLAIATHPAAALLVCLVASFEQTYVQILSSGMETGLAFVSLLMVVRLLQGESPDSLAARRTHLLSISLALLFFARLDGALMWVALSCVVLAARPIEAGRLRARVRFLFRLFRVPAALAAVYFIANRVVFSTAMPVSGKIKAISIAGIRRSGILSYLQGALRRLIHLYQPHSLTWVGDRVQAALAASIDKDAWELLFGGLYLLVLLVPLVTSIRALLRAHRDDLALRVLVLYVALHTAYYVLLQSDVTSMTWAKGPETVLLSLLAGHILFRLGSPVWSTTRERQAVGVAIAVLFVASWGYNRYKARESGYVRDFSVATVDFWCGVDHVKTDLPEDAVLTSPSIGFLGYFTGRRVMSLDGLLNSEDYYENYLKKGRAIDYLDEHGVRYVVSAVWQGDDPVAWLSSRLPGLAVDRVKVLHECDEGRLARVPRKYVVFDLGRASSGAPPRTASSSDRIRS